MSGQNVQNHYSGADTGTSIAARILAALRSVNGSDAVVTPEALEPLDHFNARGVEATRELVALLEPRVGETILDIGCGIGGPARWTPRGQYAGHLPRLCPGMRPRPRFRRQP
jgi:hypothetical protein